MEKVGEYLADMFPKNGSIMTQCFGETIIGMMLRAARKRNNQIKVYCADTIAKDGHIANKIGTLQIAILAKYFGIPYFVTGIPDADKEKGSDIVIEERDPKEVLSYGGMKNTLEGVKGIYPSFDITPPHLISGIVTDKGIFSSYDLKRYFETETQKFY